MDLSDFVQSLALEALSWPGEGGSRFWCLQSLTCPWCRSQAGGHLDPQDLFFLPHYRLHPWAIAGEAVSDPGMVIVNEGGWGGVRQNGWHQLAGLPMTTGDLSSPQAPALPAEDTKD